MDPQKDAPDIYYAAKRRDPHFQRVDHPPVYFSSCQAEDSVIAHCACGYTVKITRFEVEVERLHRRMSQAPLTNIVVEISDPKKWLQHRKALNPLWKP